MISCGRWHDFIRITKRRKFDKNCFCGSKTKKIVSIIIIRTIITVTIRTIMTIIKVTIKTIIITIIIIMIIIKIMTKSNNY